MIPNLRGTTAILTGGSRGLGVYIGGALARNGVNIALAARSTKELEAVASGLSRCGIKAVPITLDVTDEAGRANLLRQTEASLGPVDILINNAAVEGAGRFMGKTSPEIEQIIATNLTAPVLLTHLALPGMIERQRGHIINIASLAGKMGNPFAAVYGATKAGLLGLTKTWAKELTSSRDEKVRFHAASNLVKSKSTNKIVMEALDKAARDVSEITEIRNLAKEALKERGIFVKD